MGLIRKWETGDQVGNGGNAEVTVLGGMAGSEMTQKLEKGKKQTAMKMTVMQLFYKPQVFAHKQI